MRVTPPNGIGVDLGTTEASPTIGIVDYSRRETDAFGVTTVVRRDFSRRMSVKLAVPTSRIDANMALFATLRAKAALWSADPRYAWLNVTGYYEDLSVDLPYGDLSYCTLTVAGLAERETVADTGADPAANGRRSTLRFVEPVTITDAVLVSSSLAEDDAAAWSSSATYGAGATVARGHRVYESLVAGNVGHDPAEAGGQWLDTGPTNLWAMFDQALGSATIASAPVEIVLKAATATSALALLDTNAATVRVRASSYDRTVVPDAAGKALFLDFAAAAGANVTVTITPAATNAAPRRWDDGAQWLDSGVWQDSLAAGDGTVTIGTFLYGAMKGLGTTEASPTAGITDYSVKERDEFGEVTVVERAWAKNMAVKAQIASSAVDVVANRIAAVRATPALWIGDTVRDSLIVYGFFRDFSIEIGESVSKLSLSIEGLSKAAPIAPPSTGGSVAWPDITDPDGTKPDNNATNGRDPSSPFGPDKTVGDVLEDVRAAIEGAGVDVDALLEQAEQAAGALVSAAEDRLDNALEGANQAATAADGKAASALRLINDPGTGVVSRVSVLEGALNDESTGVYSRLTTTERVLNTPSTGIVARILDLEAAAYGGDAGGGFGARLSTLELVVGDANSGLSRRASQLESSSSKFDGALNENSRFSLWPDGEPLPSRWGLWQGPAPYRTSDDFGRPILGINSNQADGGLVQEVSKLAPGWYVLEARAWKSVYATMLNTGLLLHLLDDAGAATGELIGYHFYEDVGHGQDNTWYSFSRLIRVPDRGRTKNRALLHLMSRYQAFSGANSVNNTLWEYARVRPASAAEVLAQKADAALGGEGGVLARLSTMETAYSDPMVGLVRRTTDLETSLNTAGTGALAKLRTLEQAVSTPGSGLVSRTSAMEASASVAGGWLNGNVAFSVWPTGQQLPTLWSVWQGSPATWNVERGESGSSAAPFFIQINGFGDSSETGFVQATPGMTAAGWYALVVEAELVNGFWIGAGVCFRNGRFAYSFATQPDIDNVVSHDKAGIRRWSFLFHKDADDTNALHAMQNYRPFGNLHGKVLNWRFLGVRPATDGEIKAQRADAALNTPTTGVVARLSTAEQVLGDANGGIVKRTSDLETELNRGGNSVKARLSTAEYAISNADGTGLAQRTFALETAVTQPGTGIVARLSTAERAISNSDGTGLVQRASSLEVAVNGTGQPGSGLSGRLSTVEGVTVGPGNKLKTYWSVEAIAGTSTRSLRLISDGDGGGGFFIDSDVYIRGRLLVDGEITARKFDRNSMSRIGSATFSGSITPAAGQTANVPWSLSLGAIPPLGRFIYEYTIVVSSNAGQRLTSTRNGRPFYTDFVDDGGPTVVAQDAQGNRYYPRANGSDPVLATTDFVATFTASVFNNSYDSGIRDEGDYYIRQVSATYTLLGINLRATWVAI